MVNIKTLTVESNSWTRRVASKPFMSGIETSIRMMSGLSCFTSSTAWRPSRASPTISSDNSLRSMALMPSTNKVWSSQIRIRSLLFTLYLPTTKDTQIHHKLQGKFNPEPAAPSGRGFHTNAPAHQFDGLTDGRQAKPDARKLLLRVYSDERHEDSLLVCLGNAHAVIVDFDPA